MHQVKTFHYNNADGLSSLKRGVELNGKWGKTYWELHVRCGYYSCWQQWLVPYQIMEPYHGATNVV